MPLPLVTEEPFLLSFFSPDSRILTEKKKIHNYKNGPHTHCNNNSEHGLNDHRVLGTPLCLIDALPHLFYPTILPGGFHNYQHTGEENTWKG